MSIRYVVPESKIYHTLKDCVKLQNPRFKNGGPQEVLSKDVSEEFVQCKWCKARENSDIPLPMANVLTQLGRYRYGTVVNTPGYINVYVKNQPTLSIDLKSGSWKLINNEESTHVGED